jgi:hypothetical protein
LVADHVEPHTAVGALRLDPGCSVVVLAEADETGYGDGGPFSNELQGGGGVEDSLFVVES